MKSSVRYLRRSKKTTIPGESVSVEDQRTRAERLEAEHGYEFLQEFVDDGVSAWREEVERPGFEALCRRLAAGGVGVVVADAPDRLSRAGGRAYLAFREMCAEYGVEIHTVANGLDQNRPEDETAEIPAYLAGWAAKKESADKSRRLRQRSAERARNGEGRNAGPTPFGWDPEDRNRLHPVHADLLRDAAVRILRGGSLAGVLRHWNGLGVKTSRGGRWSLSGLKAALTRPRNAGLSVLRGEVVEGVTGCWEPLWDLQQHLGLCALLDSRGGGRAPVSHLLSGILACHCGAAMRAANAGKGLAVYRCIVQTQRLPKGGLEHCTIMRGMVDDRVTEEVLSILLRRPDAAGVDEGAAASLGALYADLTAVQASVAALVEAVVSGALKPADVAVRRAELEAQEQTLQGKIRQVSKENAAAALLLDLHRTMWAEGAPSFADAGKVRAQLRERWEGLGLEDKRALVRSHVSVSVSPGRGVGRVQIDEVN